MADTINLTNYEISNAVAAESTSPDNYLIDIIGEGETVSKQFKIPNKLASQATVVRLGEQDDKRKKRR